MIPFFEVSHLPSSASFYSAIFQPLGLFYLSATGEDLTPPTSPSSWCPPGTAGANSRLPNIITYGTSSPPTPVFQIRETASPRLSRATFSASSSQTVADFHAFATRANPSGRHQGRSASEPSRASIVDLDGNTMNVVHGDQTRHGRDTASRVIDWSFDVSPSEPKSSAPTEAPTVVSKGSRQDAEPCTILRRSITTSTVERSPREADNKLNTTVFGALLGVAAGAAAGAALTYTLMKGERERAPKQEFEAPPIQRRATCPDMSSEPREGRYVEVERTIEKIRYPEGYAPMMNGRTHPQHSANSANYPNGAYANSRGPGRAGEDARSQYSKPPGSSGQDGISGHRLPQEDSRAPLMIMDTESQSVAGSQRTALYRPQQDPDQRTQVSARSNRSSRTVRGPPPPTVQTELSVRGRAPSAVGSKAGSRAPSTVAPKAPSVAPSRAPTTMSANARGQGLATSPSKAPSKAPTVVPSKGPSRPGLTSESLKSLADAHAQRRALAAANAANQASPKEPGPRTNRADNDREEWETFSVAPSESISCINARTGHAVDAKLGMLAHAVAAQAALHGETS